MASPVRVGQPKIVVRTDGKSPTTSSLPLPSWSSLTGSRGKTVSAQAPVSFFRKEGESSAAGSQRFGNIVSAHIGNLDKSTWRRGLRFLRPFSSAKNNESTAAAAFRWLFVDDAEDNGLEHDTEAVFDENIEDQTLLATPELNLTGAFARRGSQSHSSPQRTHKRLVSSISAPLQPPVPPPLRRKPSRPPPEPSWRQRLGLSRFAVGLLCMLLLLGLKEVFRGKRTERKRLAVLEVHTSRWVHSPKMLLRSLKLPLPSSSSLVVPYEELDTTAVVLSYKRRSNLIVTLAHLCHFLDKPFRDVFVWNNDPSHLIAIKDLRASGCPAERVKVFNSPANMLFFARYLACAQQSTPHCYFQDDDFLVWPLRTLHAQFMRDPGGSMVVAGGIAADSTTSADLYSWKRCFYDEPSLHTCFAWVGAGAFVTKQKVIEFLRSGISGAEPMTSDETGMADNAFSTLLNRPPYVLAHSQITLIADSARGFSDGQQGETRNQQYIVKGLQRLLKNPSIGQDNSRLSAKADFSVTRPPPLPPHPHAHHTRAPCASDSCLFITNVAALPSPTSHQLPGFLATNFSLSSWERRGDEEYSELLRWSVDYPYFAAVDEDYSTVWRSPDVMKRGDYVGLMLVDALVAAQGSERTRLTIALDDAEDVLAGGLGVEVSLDGYRWSKIANSTANWACRSLPERSRAPLHHFPKSPLLSPLAARLRDAESTWRAKRSERIRACSYILDKTLPGHDSSVTDGWRFIRAVFSGKESAAVGWAIHEITIDDEIQRT